MKFLRNTLLMLTALGASLLLSGCSQSNFSNVEKLNVVAQAECATPNENASAWHMDNLYDCKNGTWFIPYQLWTGAKFDGNKATSKNHEADNYSRKINGKSVEIKGVKEYTNKITGKTNLIYIRNNGGKIQYFTSNDMGIGRVFDSRQGGQEYSGTGIKFPAGYGWKLNTPRTATDIRDGVERTTKIELTNMSFSEEGNLLSITFKWWSNGILDHKYTYTANNGIYITEKQ